MSRITINSNVSSLIAQRQLSESTVQVRSSLERLSSGLRINKASDDAAGLAISSRLNVDKRVFGQAIRNIGEGASYLNIAEGALTEMTNILVRLKELAQQSANGVLGDTQRVALEREVDELSEEYNRLIEVAEFNGRQIFVTDHTTLTVQAGYGERGEIAVAIGPDTDEGIIRASVDSGGTEGNFFSADPSISADGRYVAFESNASNLVAGDTNGAQDVFVHDRQTGQTTRVSVDSGGVEGNAFSARPSISADGRYVAFFSSASNLVAGDTNGTADIFVHDRQTGQTTRVSVDSGGTEANSNSLTPSISADGRYIAFDSNASNLVAGDTNGTADVFVHDRQTGQTTRVSVDSGGTGGSNISLNPSISADGRYVAFESSSNNLVAGDTNALRDIFVHDRQTGETARVNIDSGGAQATGGNSFIPSISADGRYVAFESGSTNLVAGDTNGVNDIFVHDRQTGQTTRVSVNSGGTEGNAGSATSSLSADGRYVAFRSNASNLVADDTNGFVDVFVHDRQTGQTTRVSVNNGGVEGNNASLRASISADGRFVGFESNASNLVAGDSNGGQDIFVATNPFLESFAITPLSGLSVATQGTARLTLDLLDTNFAEIAAAKGRIGSGMSRLETASANLRISVENIAAAESRIVDVDVAEESARLQRASILQQAGAAVLAQANQLPALALRMLEGI